jgi:hypothetical protein
MWMHLAPLKRSPTGHNLSWPKGILLLLLLGSFGLRSQGGGGGKKKKTTLGWVVNGGRRHAEPEGDDDPPQLWGQLTVKYHPPSRPFDLKGG